MKRLYHAFYLLALVLSACVKPYSPPSISTPNSYLVVEGVINIADDTTVIKISRTVKLNNQTTLNPELGAAVTLEGEHQYSITFFDYYNNGHYINYATNLPTDQRYRLRITLNSGKQYLSDYISSKPTPPIDSIGYAVKNNVLNLYVNAHDETNSTRLYRWDFEETWQFHSKYQSSYVAIPSGIVPRNTYEQVYYCFGNALSQNILLNSTTKLAKDVVYQSPLAYIPITSEKLETKYSVLVRQYALTQPAFDFYQNLKKNTEQLGSIFDVQPTQFQDGNIHSVVNPKEYVIGYLTMTNVQTKRIFISNADLPRNALPIYPYDCKQDTALYVNKQGNNDVQAVLVNPPIVYIPTSAIIVRGAIVGYLYSSPECADCTLRGTTQPPWFWQ
ncbi:MAG: DUF4249 domain-containing protein [Mucilaginibacter sp.]